MRIEPLNDRTLETAARWLSQKENYQWLDFGQGKQVLDRVALKFMSQRKSHCLRTFTDDTGGIPIGLVGLSEISENFKTAVLWYVLGDKRYAGQGCTRRAVELLLDHGFGEIGLRAISAWTVSTNHPSIRILERTGFQRIGTQRQCHRIGDEVFNRVLFDLLKPPTTRRREDAAEVQENISPPLGRLTSTGGNRPA